jgi:hypothetical protein
MSRPILPFPPAPKDSIMPREPFPLLLSLAAALTTGTGLIAATLGIKWGSPPPPGDALPNAWLYVNILWTLTTLILWPAAALFPRASRALALSWQAAGLLAGVLPALIVSAYLSNITLPMLVYMLALQFASTLLMLAILHLHTRFPRVSEVFYTLLAASVLLGPIAAFLWAQFFPSGSDWSSALPLLTVAHAATAPKAGPATSALWLAPLLQVVLAGILFLWTTIPSAQKKAPGTEVPRA